jgi:hypothetical protein
MTTAEKLVWNSNLNAYEAPYDDTRTLYVDGDAFAEARRESALAYLSEKHPEMSEDEISEFASEHNEDDEVEACFDKAEDELIKTDLWANNAVEVDEYGERTDGATYDYEAWIREDQ